MKRKWLGLALAAVMACAGAATQSVADVLAEDSAANYTAETFVSGANQGSGFGAWEFWNAAPTLADSTAGVCGDINSENGVSFRFAQDGVDDHWGYCNGYRGFDALNPGDVLTFRFTCAYCGGNRGLDLFANGGHSDDDKIANVINLSGDNEYSVNGVVIANNWAPHAVSEVAVSQLEDGIEIAIKRTSTEEGVEDLEYSTKVETSSRLTGIGLYAGGWDWNDGVDVENYAFYVNDLKIEGVPPADTLKLEGPWAVTKASAELEFTLTRKSTDGDLEVALTSSYPEFAAVPDTVTIPDGASSVTFVVTAAVQGNGNVAAIKASAEGIAGDSFEVKGPSYSCNPWDEGVEDPWNVDVDEARTFYVDSPFFEDAGFDNSLVTVASSDESVIGIASKQDWAQGENGMYAAWTVTGIGGGKATAQVLFAGIPMTEYGFTVPQAGATLSGPTSLRVGNEATYTLAVTLAGDIESDTFQLVADNEDLVSIDPSDAQELTASGTLEFKVTALKEGDVTLSVIDDKGLDADIAPITVSITEAPDYSGYVAYDDASLYEGTFDFSSTGAGQEGFGAWKVVQSDAEWGDVIVDGGDAGMPAILSDDGKALALYANGGETPVYSVVRPFSNTLQPGQKASVEFVASEASGSRVVRFVRIEESGIYNRFEIWNNSGAIGINVDGVETALNWPNGLRRVEASIELAADGSSYTLELLGHNPGSDLLIDDIYKHVVNSDVGYWGGGIQGIFFEGSGSGENFVFNRLAIEQVEEPVPPAPPAVTMALSGVWNPDEVGVPYEFTLTPSEVGAIGLVDLSLEGEGAELSATQVDLAEGAATFTFTLTGDTLPSGAEFKITASAQDVDVEDATYGITVWEPSTMLVVVGGQYEFDYVAGGTVEFWLYGTPKFVGQQANLDSGNEAILAPPSPAVATVVPYYTESDEGKFAYTMVGTEEGQAWVHATKDEAEWGYAGITINGKAAEPGDVVPVKSISIKDGAMTLTLDGPATSVYGATELENHGWKWQALDLAIVGDGTSVTLPMDAPKMIFKVE